MLRRQVSNSKKASTAVYSFQSQDATDANGVRWRRVPRAMADIDQFDGDTTAAFPGCRVELGAIKTGVTL